MEGFRKRWMAGCQENGLSESEAQDIWENILEFAGYGFNKSHSASYALQAYQDMWLKINYPLEFYAALLTYPKKTPGFVESVVREAKILNVDVKPPSVNKSDFGFTLDGNTLRYGLLAVKGVADAAANEVIRKRPFIRRAPR
jgi:DNA polymerase-3 subunit alpha